MINTETEAVYHILQLAQQGRPIEVVSQYLASWFLTGEVSGLEILDQVSRIQERTLTLMLNPENIWDGLLPGGPGDSNDALITISQDAFGELEQAERVVREIITAMSPDISDEQRMEAVSEIFLREGYITKYVDPYMYTVSIIVNPSVGHDGPRGMTLRDAWKIPAESPLNLARIARNEMERIDGKNGDDRWPAEELVMWITHDQTGDQFYMTWDQACAIEVIEKAKEDLGRLDFDTPDLDEMFQGIQDQMVLQAQEWCE